MDACIGFARSKGAREVMLLTNDVLKPAVALYESAGFKAAERVTNNRIGFIVTNICQCFRRILLELLKRQMFSINRSDLGMFYLAVEISITGEMLSEPFLKRAATAFGNVQEGKFLLVQNNHDGAIFSKRQGSRFICSDIRL